MPGRSTDEGSRAALLERLADGPMRIAATAHGATEPSSRPSAALGEPWTRRQNVAHLVLVERLVFQARLAQLQAAGEPPSWSWTEPGTSDAAELATLDAALAAFAAARAETVALVAGLDDRAWLSFGHHATYGRLDVAGLLQVVVDHDEHHRADIERPGRTDPPR